MANPQTQPPVRNPNGQTTDFPWGPFADNGNGNPAFYHQVFDDFDSTLNTGSTGIWIASKTSTGTVAHTPGDGGLALFTTAATIGDSISIQAPTAAFTYTAGKKLFFEVRLQLSDISLSSFQLGLIQTTTTPATVTDGIYFSKASGSTQIYLNSVVSSVVTQIAIPAAAFNPFANATFFELAFYVNRKGEILAFAGTQLVGWIPESGTGLLTLSNRGVLGRLTSTTITTVNLNPTMAFQAGAAVVKTGTVDFVCVAKER